MGIGRVVFVRKKRKRKQRDRLCEIMEDAEVDTELVTAAFDGLEEEDPFEQGQGQENVGEEEEEEEEEERGGGIEMSSSQQKRKLDELFDHMSGGGDEGEAAPTAEEDRAEKAADALLEDELEDVEVKSSNRESKRKRSEMEKKEKGPKQEKGKAPAPHERSPKKSPSAAPAPLTRRVFRADPARPLPVDPYLASFPIQKLRPKDRAYAEKWFSKLAEWRQFPTLKPLVSQMEDKFKKKLKKAVSQSSISDTGNILNSSSPTARKSTSSFLSYPQLPPQNETDIPGRMAKGRASGGTSASPASAGRDRPSLMAMLEPLADKPEEDGAVISISDDE